MSQPTEGFDEDAPVEESRLVTPPFPIGPPAED